MNDETTNLIEKAETIATMIEDRMWPALDVNDSNTLRQIAAALEAAKEREKRLRTALQSAGNVIDSIATATSSIPAFMPILEQIEAALASGRETP